MKRPPRILIISIKAGAGHIRAAAAIEAAFRQRYPEALVENIEGLAYTNPAFRQAFSGTYEKLARNLPSVWGYIYDHLEKKPAKSHAKQLAAFFDRANAKPLRKKVEAFDPDAIVCTHYFPAEVFAIRRRKNKLRARLFVTLTDYDIHTMWVQDGVDHYFVATEEMVYGLHEKGIESASATATGIPVLPEFMNAYPPQREMLGRLGVHPEKRAVLLSAGGFGLTRIDDIAARLAETFPDTQFIAIAGSNKSLYKQLSRVAKSHPESIYPRSFVDNMHEYMAASNIIVTKSGGLTSSECLAMGLPMLILRPIPGQEERNADYLLENGAAMRCNSPAHLLFKCKRLLEDTERYDAMRQAIRHIARPYAAWTICDTVMNEI